MSKTIGKLTGITAGIILAGAATLGSCKIAQNPQAILDLVNPTKYEAVQVEEKKVPRDLEYACRFSKKIIKGANPDIEREVECLGYAADSANREGKSFRKYLAEIESRINFEQPQYIRGLVTKEILGARLRKESSYKITYNQ